MHFIPFFTTSKHLFSYKNRKKHFSHFVFTSHFPFLTYSYYNTPPTNKLSKIDIPLFTTYFPLLSQIPCFCIIPIYTLFFTTLFHYLFSSTLSDNFLIFIKIIKNKYFIPFSSFLNPNSLYPSNS